MVRKFFFTCLIALSLLLTASGILTYVYQDEIITHFVKQADQFLATPVKVKSIQLSFWEKFPQIAISLKEVEIKGSQTASDSLLAQAEKLDFTFNLWQFVQGQFVVDKVYLTNSQVRLAIDKQGNNNYSIFKKRSSVDSLSSTNEPLRFQLQKIILKNVDVSYQDAGLNQAHHLLAEDIEALLEVVGEEYDILLEGNLFSRYIRSGDDAYFKNKPLHVATHLNYDYPNRFLEIDTTRLGIGNGHFLLSGLVDQADDNFIDLQARGEHTDLQTLLSLLPESIVRQWSAYRSEGKAFFEGSVKGHVSRTASPAVSLNFGCENASFYHPDYKKKLENISLQGSFTNGKSHSLNTSVLNLKDIYGQLDDRAVRGSLSLSNFKNYFLRCHLKTNIDVNALLDFYPIKEVKAARGELFADFEIAGRLKDLKGESKGYWQRIKSSGDISLQDVDLLWQADRLPVSALQGNLMFKGNDLSLSNLEAYVGNSHVLLNGMLRNALAYMLSDTQGIHIEADLHSQQIDMDELLSGQANAPQSNSWQAVSEKQDYRFQIDPKIQLSFDCHVEKIKFRRFRGRQLKGKLQVENQVARLKQSSILTAGGKVSAQAFIDARRPDFVKVNATTAFEHLRADSIFYTFEDFGQDFLTQKHLEGKIYADVDWNMNFDQHLQLNYPSLEVNALTTIRDGRLNDFEPMQKLARFVEEESLSRLRFAELNNHIRIADQKIFIPRMQVSSNISDIWVEGIHTFDNHIDYRFEVPMKTFSIRKAAARERAQARQEKFGRVLEDDSAPINLFLTALGTVDDYKISYDMQAAKSKFKDNLQNEKEELKQIIKNKGKETEYQLELEEEEYFDFGSTPPNTNPQP
ncbi:AsmA-like C-terminal region-containing protein [Porifericola rhodea]|uniref:AsmA family protein n=1 Tax=Porifericola rhodea TaxID=930972 RepID=UPI002666EEAB|nr:AsmA-like C-terminal region-containing protein [Porifericola rhodea]WKN33070.1 AsmA-like C-terminal region-containing protein [Porifericola rhodea]